MLGENETLVRFGLRLKELREAKGWSQRQLSYNCSVDHSKIGKMERGLINPTLVTLVELAKGLEVHLTELMEFQ